MLNEQHFDKILQHYIDAWGIDPSIYLFDKGPIDKLYADFKVLEFPPKSKNTGGMWIYSTCCMSAADDEQPIELYMYSDKQDTSIIELLTVVAYYHKNSSRLNLWHTVNFGRSWQDKSLCKYGLISLPYLHGPSLENLFLGVNNSTCVKFYWLIPVTLEEVNYKKKNGVDALEQLFEKESFNYLDPDRKSVTYML